MKPVTVQPAAVDHASSTQRQASDQVAAQAAAERIDVGALTPTFGLIGAGFLAALTDVAAGRARTLAALARAHGSTSTSITRAGAAYCDCDDAGSRAVAV